MIQNISYEGGGLRLVSDRATAKRMRSPHKTTKQLSSTNLIFSHRNEHETILLYASIASAWSFAISRQTWTPTTSSKRRHPASPPPASSLSTPTIYKVANVSKLFLCHNKLFICNVACRGSSTRLRRWQTGLPNGANAFRRRQSSSEVHKCRILDNMIQQWSGIGEENGIVIK